MRALLPLFLSVLCLSAQDKPKVKITTSLGEFTVQLEPSATPKTVDNFLKYVKKGFFNGTTFHRVNPSAGIIQGGGFLPNGSRRMPDAPVTHEGDLAKAQGLKNVRGTIAMALPASNPFGATSQFFINTKANPTFDFKAKTMTGYGYCPFGKVTQGMDVVDKIAKQPVGKDAYTREKPVTAIVILKVEEVR